MKEKDVEKKRLVCMKIKRQSQKLISARNKNRIHAIGRF
jgi:hypothetical protein